MTRDEAFRQKYELAASGCWEWRGARTGDGYALFWNGNRMVRGHRWAYERFVGPIPDGLHVDHLCRNRACVNPLHLEPVTNGENQRRGLNSYAIRTLCKKGLHDISDPRNVSTQSKGGHTCRPCDLEGKRARKRALKLVALTPEAER